MRSMSRRFAAGLFAALTMLALPSAAQAPAPQSPTFKPEELEQLAAPIALYPDSLMAQVLMASTYPLEVVQAARFLKANPNLMDQKLEWTQKLGDAFLAQQKELLDAIQRLRARAQAEGNLKTTQEQVVKV